jgi:hypothetical protein
MHMTAPVMISSPRHAPAGADDRPEARAANTPRMATQTPRVLRIVSGSTPRSAPTTMVYSGNVASARLARAAVVNEIAML